MSSLLPSLWGGSDNNGAPLHSLHREIDKVFSEFSRNFGLPSLAPTNGKPGALFSPSIDVIEKDKALEITTELPGVSEKDVEVTIVDNMLTIQGEKKPKKRSERRLPHGRAFIRLVQAITASALRGCCRQDRCPIQRRHLEGRLAEAAGSRSQDPEGCDQVNRELMRGAASALATGLAGAPANYRP